MFLDVKKRGKKGLFVLSQNLVILIIILVLAGIVGYIVYRFVSGKLVPFQ